MNGNSEILQVPFKGKDIIVLGVQNDRINTLYEKNPFNLKTPAEFAKTTFARVFQYACNNDPLIDKIVAVAKIVYPNDPVKQFQYVVGFETKGLTYVTDTDNFGENEYVAFPSITLYAQSGDCEDRATFLGALMKKVGFDVTLVILKGKNGGGHAIVGVNLSPELEALTDSGSVYYEFNGKKYYCFEGTNFIPINQIKPYFTAEGYTPLAIIPSTPQQQPLVANIRAMLKVKP